MRASKGYLFRACYNKGVSHQHYCLADIQRQADEWESFIWKKGKALSILIGGCCHGEAVSGLTKSRAANMIGYGSVSSFLWLVLSWQQGQKLGKLSVTDQVLAVLGQWLLRLLFSFLDWLWQVEGQNSTFLYGLALTHLYIQCLSEKAVKH